MTAATRVSLLQFESFAGTRHAVSTRHGGASVAPYHSLNMGYATADRVENVTENRRRFTASLGATLEQVVAGRLSHGNSVAVFRSGDDAWPEVRSPVPASLDLADRAFRADGVIGNVPGLVFLLTFADCVPLLFADPIRGVVGAAHAGWRGTSLSIGPAVVRAMERVFGSRPADIRVGIGPSIGPCCYTVGEEVLATFAARSVTAVTVQQSGTTLDLWTTNELQLTNAGVRPDHIENPRHCTSCKVDTYFSHRAERGVTGRGAACIGLD